MLALENFAIAVIASLGVATLYFLVTPLGLSLQRLQLVPIPHFLMY